MNKETLTKSFVHLMFCVIVVFFFRNNSFLRPTAFGALYKEYIAGIIVLSVCYLNYFVLFPKFYETRRLGRYVTVSLLVLAITSLVEERLVYPNIYEVVKNLNIDFHRYFANQTGMIYLRDFCFFLFSFMFCLIHSLNEDKRELYRYLQDYKHLIVANEIQDKSNVTIDCGDITHCQQKENYAYFYLINGKRYTKNCTLADLSDDIGPDFCVRISRNIIVMYAYIQSYNQENVFVQTYEGILGFKITNYYREKALSLLLSNVIGTKIEFKEPPSVELPLKSSIENSEIEQISPIDEIKRVEDNPAILQILSFINEHPNCKVGDITRYYGLSRRTASRILKQLKDEGLIKYEGSKKTGGYSVVSS